MPAAAAVLIALGASGGVVVSSSATQPARAAQREHVSTARVQREDLSATVSQDGTLAYQAEADGSPYTVINQARGAYTELPAIGRVVRQGQVLYRVNESPLVLLYGSTPAYRTLSAGMTGPDVAELNTDLVALGYANRAQLGPTPSTYGSATTIAVRKLQAALGLTQNGILSLGQAVFEPAALRVTARSALIGGSAEAGQIVMQGTSTRRQVQVALDATEQTDMAVGDRVTITLPNNRVTHGVVTSVGTVATCASGSGSGGSSSSSAAAGTDGCSSGNSSNSTPTVNVDVTPSDPAATGTWDEAPVQVGITTSRVPNAVVVPVTALLARANGGRGHRRQRQPSRAGLAGAVRRCARAGAGHRLTARRRSESGGPVHVTTQPAPVHDVRADPVPVPVLELDGVSKSYPGEPPVHALRGVSLAIGQGELVAIVGPSASGKTTLLQLMGTLDRPTSGQVRITGLDVATLADDDVTYLRATRIGFVFQQFFLAEHAPVLDNVADGLLYAGVPLTQRRQRALDALELVGLAGRPDARPTQLSGGQRQRVAIARALVGQPAIVLADEPTGNLDQATGHAILALIDQLHQAGSTIVVITHDNVIAERMPRKVAILDGEIVADTGSQAS